MKYSIPTFCLGALIALVGFSLVITAADPPDVSKPKPFPAVMPQEKPTDRPLSASWSRMWDRWNPHEDRGNELFSNFKYTLLQGFSREPNVSRRDPSKVLKIDGTYYVW